MHIVMDFVNGQTYKYFHQLSVEIKRQCLKRVEQLHAIRLLHGDLRIQNFIINKNGVVFIIDFGRSKFIEPGEEAELELEMANFRLELNLNS